MSIERTNTISSIIVNTAFESGATALAATSALMAPPIGALGGAIFGATRFLTFIPLALFTNKYLQDTHPQASAATKTLAAVIKFFGSYAAAWGALTLAGFSLTVRATVLLSCVSLLTMAVSMIFLEFVGLRF
jgi:hypothetical protein